MLTILEAIKLSTDYLEKKGIESARLNIELMLAEILNCNRLNLYLSFERPLKDFELDKLREWIARRGKNEPLQYIIGKADFYGIPFTVNSNVLIPRSETETLVETIIFKHKQQKNLRVLDIGAGSGVIPVVLALNLVDSQIISIDNSLAALEVAKQNATNHKVDGKIEFRNIDLFKTSFSEASFDIVVSNPPYVSITEYSTLQKEILDYEPKQAVTDMADGYKFYSFISEMARKWLGKGGKLYFEVGKDQSEKVKNIMSENNFVNISVTKDLLNIERVVVGEKL